MNNIAVVAADHFTQGRLVTVIIDADDIASSEPIGMGDLNGKPTPVVRLNFKDGAVEDVFDAYGAFTAGEKNE